MSNWKSYLSDFIENIDSLTDKIRRHWREKKGYRKNLTIVPYIGFGTNKKIFLRGRVIAEKRQIISTEKDGRRRNLRNFFRRFATDEIPFARVSAKFENIEIEAVTDDEGYFYLELENFETRDDQAQIREIELELLSPLPKNGENVRNTGKVLIPSKSAKFGIISDLDDTVITTNVSSKLKMLLNTALRNEYTRLPFEGVSEFYKALQKGIDQEQNPFFYVSSSPWNLYPFLIEFLRFNEIPHGALFLKDFGNHTIFNSSDHSTHKTESIEKILQTYPNLPFILIGDNGESDPQIYAEIVHKFPDRIRTIYIRSVRKEAERLSALNDLIAEIAKSKVQLILAEDTEFAAVHAAAENLIEPSALEKIRIKKKIDENLPFADEL